MTRDGCDLLSADSGEDAVAVVRAFASACDATRDQRGRHARGGKPFQLVGRLPVGVLSDRRRSAAPSRRQARLGLRSRPRRRARTRTARTRTPPTTATTTSTASSTCPRSSAAAPGSSPSRAIARIRNADARVPIAQIVPTNEQKPAGRHADPRRRADQARLLHRQGEPHLRPGARATIRAATATPSLTALRQADHAEPPRAGPAVPAARPRLRQLGGLDRRPLLDRGRRGLRLRGQELAAELRAAAAAPTTSAPTR